MKTLFNITLVLLALAFIGYTKTGRVDTGNTTSTVPAQEKWVRCYQNKAWCTAVGSGESEIFIRIQIQHYFLSRQMESVQIVRYARCEEAGKFLEVSWELGEKYGIGVSCDGVSYGTSIPQTYLNELDPLPPKIARIKKHVEAHAQNNLIL